MFEIATKYMKEKCTSVDAYDQIVVFGVWATKAHVYPFSKDQSSGSSVSSQTHNSAAELTSLTLETLD